jgi:hypothetical protein
VQQDIPLDSNRYLIFILATVGLSVLVVPIFLVAIKWLRGESKHEKWGNELMFSRTQRMLFIALAIALMTAIGVYVSDANYTAKTMQELEDSGPNR